MPEAYNSRLESLDIKHFGKTSNTLYVLKVRETQEIFYVGCTTMGLKKRLYYHLHNSYEKEDLPVSQKIQSIRRNKQHIVICGLCVIDEAWTTEGDRDLAHWYEAMCIHLLREKQVCLCNVHKQKHTMMPMS